CGEWPENSAGEGDSERTHSGKEAELPSTPAPDLWTSCTPESVRGYGPAPQYGTDRQPSRRMGAKTPSRTPHDHGLQPGRAGGSYPDWTSVSLYPTSTAGDHQ